MMRQCAWCLRLIDSRGERVSQLPLPKLYEASHGMCDVCGMQWLQQMLGSSDIQNTPLWMYNAISNDMTDTHAAISAECSEKPSRTTTQLAHELEQHEPETIDASLHTV